MAHVFERGGTAPPIVAFHGEIDLSTADAIRNAAELALRSGYRSLVADLSAVTFMDSQGVKALVVANAALEAAGGRLVIRDPSRPARTVLDLTGLSRVLEVEESRSRS